MQDPILFWNDVAMELNRRDHTGARATRHQRGPGLSSRALAIIHLAMHDAYTLARAGLGVPTVGNDAYLPAALRPAFAAPAGADPARYAAVAVGAAACAAMRSLYPAQAAYIDASFADYCGQWGADDAGHRFGLAVGRALVTLRDSDTAYNEADASHVFSAAPLRHRPDPLNPAQGALGVRHGFVRPFAITAWPALARHPLPGDARYTADLTEVVAKGAQPGHAGLTRTVDETIQGLYWAYDGPPELGTPPRLYNQVVRAVISGKALNTEQLARLFMLVNVAMADAGITAWHYKYHYDVWRPVLGVREHDSSMGPGTVTGGKPVAPPCDPFWLPLGAPLTNAPDESLVAGASTVPRPRPRSFTPGFPAYPSGHATFGAAAFELTRRYLAGLGKAQIAADRSDDLAFEFVSDELNGRNVGADGAPRARHRRRFAGLHEAMYENSVSRVFLGVHWRFDGTTGNNPVQMLAATDQIGGVTLGIAIAKDLLAQNNVRPSAANVLPPPFSATP